MDRAQTIIYLRLTPNHILRSPSPSFSEGFRYGPEVGSRSFRPCDLQFVTCEFEATGCSCDHPQARASGISHSEDGGGEPDGVCEQGTHGTSRSSSLPTPPAHYSAKEFPTLELKHITPLGDICSVLGQLPAPAILSGRLKICGDAAYYRGPSTNIWKGHLQGRSDKLLAIKTFRPYGKEELREVIKVSMQLRFEAPHE